jgi:hypothetical protein
MSTTKRIVEFARWLEENDPGFLATVISAETGEEFRGRGGGSMTDYTK